MERINIKLLITEKSSTQLQANKYTFLINPQTNKISLQKYLEKKYSITITSINTINYKGKTRRRGRIVGRDKGYKKAIVTLKPGQEIKELKEAF